jgi:deoxyadenosine/deoxycytidine kinase
VNLLDHIYGLLSDQAKNQLIWLNGTAGVGKSAVAFTVAEKMRGLKMKESPRERRLAGTFFFSRKYTDRCTTGSFFATLVHQLATNFPSVKDDLIAALHEDHTLQDPRKSLRKQM